MRTTVPVALALTAALALPAHGATPSATSYGDPAGDANGLNDQGLGLGVPSTSTAPASVGSVDLVGVRLATVYGKGKPHAITVTLTLADAPDNRSDYLFSASVPAGCAGSGATSLSLQYLRTVTVPATSATCGAPGTTGTPIGLGPADVDSARHTITWTLDGHGFAPRGVVTALQAQTTVLVLGVYDVATSDKAYRYQ